MISQDLAGKRIAVTGGTGFLGTALIERLLRSVPACEVVVLIRPGRRTSPTDRLKREVLKNDCFDRLRTEYGDGFDTKIVARVSAIGGDVTTDGLGLNQADREVFASCDIVIHSAAAVSFDSPIDSAVEVNLLGSTRVAQAVTSCHEEFAPEAPLPHLIAVSTAYVAGSRRGNAPEALLPETPYAAEADWKSEVAFARRIRADLEAESRRAGNLERFISQARHQLGAASIPLLTERTEKLRGEWVKDQLVSAGRTRAQSLGWPDAYAYTKALSERALLETRGDVPVTFIRPSIIESALAEPRPGWIRGFRMAEPVIISYARGLLKEFPGLPEGVIDVIPVDFVVAAIIAVAAKGPETKPNVYQVASGIRNPLRYQRLVNLVQGWFTDNPLYDSDGQPIIVPRWSFPGRGKVSRQLNRATRTLETAERIFTALPIRGKQAHLSAKFEERRQAIERAKGYVELYGAYSETEARYQVDRLLELYASLAEGDRQTFRFDPAIVEWDSFVRNIHLPSVVQQARVKTTAGKRTGLTRYERGRRGVLAPERHFAAFDLENTLISSNVIDSYSWLATRNLDANERAKFTLRMFREGPGLLALDRKDRGDFLRSFYRRYEGAPVDELRRDAWEMFSRLLLTKSFPAGLRRVREHRSLGHKTVLITGALDFAIEPFMPLFDHVVCARMEERNGRLTGELIDAPPTGEMRAQEMARFADANHFSLQESVAYADSSSDLPMLEAVGFPVAVNPEAKLAALARTRGWHVEQWSKSPGTPKPILPMGRLLRERERVR